MTNYFVRPLTGNNANAGTSHGAAWKTITHAMGATAVAAGDTVRVEESPPPTLVGDATWTDNSSNVDFDDLLVLDLHTGGNWTASAGVTCSNTTGLVTGTNASTITLGGGFAGGKAAYKTLGATVDGSPYQQISFVFKTGNAVGGAFEIKLCSDSTGDTPLHTFSVSTTDYSYAGLTSSGVGCLSIAIDNGSALSAGINSVALYANSGFTDTITIDDNFLLCKDPAADDSLTHRSLISKDTSGETFLAVKSLSGASSTTAVLVCDALNNGSGIYYGTTENVATYKRETFGLHVGSASTTQVATAIGKSGSSGSPITVSGGWNSSDMTTQSGETWFDGRNGWGIGLSTEDRSFLTFSKLGFIRYYDNGAQTLSSTDVEFADCRFNSARNYGLQSAGARGKTSGTNFASMCRAGGFLFTGSVPLLTGTLISKFVNSGILVELALTDNGVYNAANSTIKAIGNQVTAPAINVLLCSGDFGNVEVGRSQRGMQLRNKLPIEIRSLTSTLNTDAIFLNGADVKVMNFTTSSNTNVVNIGSSIIGSQFLFRNCSIAEAGDKVINIPNFYDLRVKFEKIGGSLDVNETYSYGFNIKSNTSDRNTAADKSWEVNVTSANRTQYYPGRLERVCRRAVFGGTQVNFSGAAKRTNSGISAQFRILGGRVAGVDNDRIISVTNVGTWNTYTDSFTPTEDGVVEVVFEAWGGTSHKALVDDVDMSQ